jgi:hypothetical protein
MNKKHTGRFFGFTVFLTVMVSALLMIALAACPTDDFDDVDQIAVVVAVPAGGVVDAGTLITLTCATPGVSIYYTTDNSTPSMTHGTLYGETTNKPEINPPAILKAIAVKSDMADSPVLTASYTDSNSVVATPMASPGAGAVGAGTSITLTCATDGASIHYTTDGTTPTSASTLYTDSSKPVITTATTIKAIAVKSGMDNSGVLTAAYTVYVAPAWTGAIVDAFYNDYVMCVAYGDGKFVAGTYASILNYSSDGGSSWNLINPYPFFAGNLSIRSIAYGNNTFVAVGVLGNIAVASSSDVTQWTKVTTSNFPISAVAERYSIIYGVAHGNGKFVAVGDDGNIVYAQDSDLQNWVLVANSTFGGSDIQSITYGEGKFVAVSADGKIAWSDDGSSWTAVTDSTFGGTAISGIAHDGEIFVAVGAGGKMAWSDDGSSWTAISNTTFANTTDINGICYGDGQFIAVGAYTIASAKVGMAGSSDGKTWVAIDIPGYLVDTYSIAHGNTGQFVAGGAYGVIARTTP